MIRPRFVLASALMLLSAACGDDSPAPSGATTGSTTHSGEGGGGGSTGTGGSGGAGGTAPAPDPTGFRATAPMSEARRMHTLTLLADGRVLMVGGEAGADLHPIDRVAVFDPATEQWTELDPLPEPRSNHTATLLDDGRVLVAGGGDSDIIGLPSGTGVTDTALLFDPATGKLTPTGSMVEPRVGHRALRLPDGRVLLAGGGTDQVATDCNAQYPDCTVAVSLASAEVYDPATGAFSAVGSMASVRVAFTLVDLADGSPFAVAGFDTGTVESLDSAERFDLDALEWKPAASMTTGKRGYQSGARLGSGNVLVGGGKLSNVGPTTTSEVYDPAADAWTKVQNLDEPRTGAAAISLASGHVLFLGGFDQGKGASLDKADLFDEATGTWTALPPLTEGRSLPSAVLLSDNRILICGGSKSFGMSIKCDIGE